MEKVINLITPFKNTTFTRQLSGVDKEITIVENGELNIRYEAVFVYENVPQEINIKCYEGKLIFISGEPPLSRKYSQSFLNQFDYIISSHESINHSNNIIQQQCLPWHFGYNSEDCSYSYTYNDLLSMATPVKNKKISVIASSKSMMPGHKSRLKFINALKSNFQDQIDFFGKDSHPVNDKSEAILPYMMSICVENSSINDYWTEKISDVFLGFALPIYYGCKNIENYFNSMSLTHIDTNQIQSSLQKVAYLLENCDTIYEERLEYIREARLLLLNQYNIEAFIINFFKDNFENIKSNPIRATIRPTYNFKDYRINNFLLKVERFSKKLIS